MDFDPRRIAIIKPSALGDIVHALPVLSALRAKFPEAAITWVVNKSFEGMLAGHPDLTDTLPFDRGIRKRGSLHAIKYAVNFGRELRRRKFDLVVDLQGLLRTGLMTRATGAKMRVGFENAREGSRLAYTHHVPVPDADRIHAVDRYWKVAEFLDAGNRPKRFHVPISDEARAWASNELRGLPRPIIAVAVGAKWLTKRWPPKHFAAMLRDAPGTAVFLGAGDDTPLSLDTIAGLNGPSRDFTGKTTLPQLAAILDAADVMVANDTGPLHLAAALGTPCVAPYTCTKVALHGPYGSFAGAEATSVPCAGSYIKTCPNMICMSDLGPDRLRPRLAEVLEAWANRSRSA
jgi:lipopolysaccharide heptosyltransferase I